MSEEEFEKFVKDVVKFMVLEYVKNNFYGVEFNFD